MFALRLPWENRELGNLSAPFLLRQPLLHRTERPRDAAPPDVTRSPATPFAELKRALGDADSYLSQLVRLREYEKGVAETELSEAGGDNAAQSFRDAVEEAREAVEAAKTLQVTHTSMTGDSPAGKLHSQLLLSDEDKTDDGLALVNAVSDVHDATVDKKDEIDTLKGQLTDENRNPIDLSNLGNAEKITQQTTDVTENSNDIIVSSWFAHLKKPSKSRSTIHP